MNPGILWLYDGEENGCNYYRCRVPATQLMEFGYDIDLLPIGTTAQRCIGEDIESGKLKGWSQAASGWYVPEIMTTKYHNMAVFTRPFIQTVDEKGTVSLDIDYIQNMVEQMHRGRAVVGGDADDDFFALPDYNPVKSAFSEKELSILAETYRSMDFMMTTTPFLAKRIHEATKLDLEKIYIVPNLIDFDMYDLTHWELVDATGNKTVANMREVRKQRLSITPNRPIVIGLQGGHSHLEDWRILAKVLPRVMERFGDKVKIVIAGYHPDYFKEGLAKWEAEGLVHYQGWQSFENHSGTVMSFDINLCPLLDNTFNKSKSAIKWMEASAAGAVSVVSPTLYGWYVKGGETGLIADTEQDWFDAIYHLVTNHAKRQQIARAAHLTVRTTFDLKTNAYLYMEAFEHIWETNKNNVISKFMAGLEERELARMTAA